MGAFLSPGQTDWQVVASGRKLNLRRDFTRVGWPNGLASFLTSTRKSKQNHFKADISCILLANNMLMASLNLRWLGLGGQTVKKLRRLVCKFDLDQSVPKFSQVDASALKAWPNGVASRSKFLTCVYLRVRLARAWAILFAKQQCVKPWLSGLASSRKWTQVELA